MEKKLNIIIGVLVIIMPFFYDIFFGFTADFPHQQLALVFSVKYIAKIASLLFGAYLITKKEA